MGSQVLAAEAEGYVRAVEAVLIEGDLEDVEIRARSRCPASPDRCFAGTASPAPSARVSLNRGETRGRFGGGRSEEGHGSRRALHLRGGRARHLGVVRQRELGEPRPRRSRSTVTDVDPPPLTLRIQAGALIQGQVTGLTPEDSGRPPGRRLGRVGSAGGRRESRGRLHDRRRPARHGQPSAPPWDRVFWGAARRRRRFEVSEGDTVVPVELVFPSGSRLSGRITRQSEPVVGALVLASGKGANQTSASATTDPQGGYEFQGLQDGDYRLNLLSLGSGLRLESEVEVSGDTVHDIEVPAGRIEGHVRSAEDRSPIARARVTLTADPSLPLCFSIRRERPERLVRLRRSGRRDLRTGGDRLRVRRGGGLPSWSMEDGWSTTSSFDSSRRPASRSA